jgi:ABC-type amino acid transport substrate-binding protein
MKKYQVIVRTLMAAVIMFGVETTASAQFGSLLKKAKSAVKDQVDNKAKMSKYEVKDAINQALKELTDDGTIPAIVNKYIPAEG